MHPHHDGSPLYVSKADPALGEDVTVWVRVPETAGVVSVYVRVLSDGEPGFIPAQIDNERTGTAVGGYGADDTWWAAVVPARNPVTRYRFQLGRTGDRSYWLTAAGLIDHDPPDDTDFRLVAHPAPPPWSADAIVYQIFPDRFARSASAQPLDSAALPKWALPCEWDDDEVIGVGPGTSEQFFGGDLDGIIDHLDHIQALGVNTIYLTPIFPARSNHRYNASSFDEIDPLLGGDAALGRLAEKVHQRGMRLIGDITTNHCGDAHSWFTTAVSDVHAAERQMFYFHESGGYESFWGTKSLPKLNWGSRLVRERMTAVMLRWLGPFDGWRIDVAHQTGRYRDEDRNHEIARGLRASLPDDVVLIAEYMHDPTGDLDCGGWHGTMNYSGFTRPIWTWLRGDDVVLDNYLGAPGNVPQRDGESMLAAVQAFSARLSWRSLVNSWNPLDSHDTPRIRTVTADRARHLVALGLQATLPGAPMIFAGSEYGLTGWNGESSRTPMPWNRPAERDEEVHQAYRRLFGLRAAEPALRRGSLRWLHVSADTVVYLRETAEQTLLICARRKRGQPVYLPLAVPLRPVYQAEPIVPDEWGTVTLPAGGPSFAVWRMG